jgi:hypothetical protein
MIYSRHAPFAENPNGRRKQLSDLTSPVQATFREAVPRVAMTLAHIRPLSTGGKFQTVTVTLLRGRH